MPSKGYGRADGMDWAHERIAHKGANTVEAATAKSRPKLVTVALTITDDQGNSHTDEKEIEGGPTKVAELKEELGVPSASSLWFKPKNGKAKQLADHEKHNVKEGDRYEAIVRGGVS